MILSLTFTFFQITETDGPIEIKEMDATEDLFVTEEDLKKGTSSFTNNHFTQFNIIIHKCLHQYYKLFCVCYFSKSCIILLLLMQYLQLNKIILACIVCIDSND